MKFNKGDKVAKKDFFKSNFDPYEVRKKHFLYPVWEVRSANKDYYTVDLDVEATKDGSGRLDLVQNCSKENRYYNFVTEKGDIKKIIKEEYQKEKRLLQKLINDKIALRYQHIKEIEDQIEILKSGKVSVAGEKDMGKFLDTRLDFINKFVDME